MAESNGIIEKPKLGFFQRIRKALLIRNINKTKYNKAPEYLKNDEEVVDALLAHNSYDITEVPFGHQIRALKEKPENIGVVGDQIFTDIIGGNRCKMFTILVEPIAEKDIWITMLKRPIENAIKNNYKKKLEK